jgi:hypothetical protein
MQYGNYRNKITPLSAMAKLCIAMACLFLWTSAANAAMDTIWLNSMPRQAHGDKSHNHGAGKPGSQGGSGSQAHGGHESEHRPQPVRTYCLSTCEISDEAEAYITRPEGAAEKLSIERDGHEVKVTVRTPMGEGPAHGANTVYLIDQSVKDGTLQIETAKWLTIHHNCGWGHDHKFNAARLVSQPFTGAPLEIVADNLWDYNFHSNVMSGDMISFRVLSFGQPAPGATVTVESDRGWRKTITTDKEGNGSFQLVRDYYPDSWQHFDRSKQGKLKMTARYATDDAGQYAGKSYDRTLMSSTFAWRYSPARREYASMVYGLMIAFLSMALSGFGVYYYRERRKKPYREIEFDEQDR